MYLVDDAAAHDERTEIVGFRADHFLGRIFLRAEHGDKGVLCPFAFPQIDREEFYDRENKITESF